jgi:hypothetical protein
MQVHLKKVVQSAVERGVVVGYHRINNLSKTKRANTDVMVDTMLTSIWESLDGIIDFRDENDGENEKLSRKTIGFQSTDAVSMIEMPDDNTDDDSVPLDKLYRVHRW